MTMVSAAAAAHSAPEVAFLALPIPLLSIPALSGGDWRRGSLGAIPYRVITVTALHLDSASQALINRPLSCGYMTSF
jgi:hypothetical protein